MGYVSVQFFTSEPAALAPQQFSSPNTPGSANNMLLSRKEKIPASSPGLKTHVDPETGQFQRPPAGIFSGEELPGSFAAEGTTHPQEALEEPVQFLSPVAGGGVITNVRLRFRRPLVATRDAGGKLKIQHVPQEADLNGKP